MGVGTSLPVPTDILVSPSVYRYGEDRPSLPKPPSDSGNKMKERMVSRTNGRVETSDPKDSLL